MSSVLSSLMHYISFTFEQFYCPFKRLYIGFQFIPFFPSYFYVLSPMIEHTLHYLIVLFFFCGAVESARAHPPSTTKEEQNKQLTTK